MAAQTLSYNDVRRVLLADPDAEAASVKGDSELGRVLVEDAQHLCGGGDVLNYVSGLATLFATGKQQRALAPKVVLLWDLRDHAKLVGVCHLCYWAVEEALGTERITRKYCTKMGLPAFDDYMFMDVFCSRRSPGGSILCVHGLLVASRQRARKPPGLAAIAINRASLKTFRRLHFNVHEFKVHGSTRWLCWMRLDAFRLEPLLERLRFAENDYLVRNICYRKGRGAEHTITRQC